MKRRRWTAWQGDGVDGFGRSGVMYTFVAIILLIVIGNIVLMQTRTTGHEAQQTVADRVHSVDDFIRNIEKDSKRAAYIAGFRSMIAMEQHITSTGIMLSDPDAIFKQTFVNGSTGNTTYDIMANSTFSNYLARVSQEAATQGIQFNVTITNISLWQSDPWSLLVNYTLAMRIYDERGTASWTLNRTFTGRVPVNDLRDPLFTARTYGRIQRVIKLSNISVFVDDAGNANDTTGFMTQFNSSTYIAAGRGPSILQRFKGDLNDSIYGIESLIDIDDFALQGLSVNTTAPVVDYMFFAGRNDSVAVACNIQNLPAKVKLDAAHLSVYQIQGKLNYSVCP